MPSIATSLTGAPSSRATGEQGPPARGTSERKGRIADPLARRLARSCRPPLPSRRLPPWSVGTRYVGRRARPHGESSDVEAHALRQRQLPREVDGVGGPAHVRLPRIGARLAAAARLLLAAEGAADL